MTKKNDGDVVSYFTRPSCQREDLSQRFCQIELQYKKQYAHIYYMRSQILNPRVEKAAKNKWGDHVPLKKLSEVKPHEKCCVVGTIFKSMELQPSILKEISDESHVQLQPSKTCFTSENDKLILEDSVQRISITGKLVPSETYTGSVVALNGMENEHGKFDVEDYTYAGIPKQPELPSISHNQYVVFVSGLGIGGKNEKSMQIQLLIDYVLGMLGGTNDHQLCSQIVHVIFAGNSLSKDTLDKASQTKAKYLTYKSEASTVKAMTDLDYFISQLVPYVSVDLMCGEYDLSNHVLPQKPLHSCMFPSSRNYQGNTFHTVSNPYECKINGVHLLGTSGQNINNMRMFSDVTHGIKLLSDTLQCQHLAPTAPDTLGTFPFYDKDPFVIDSCPHLYFSGNQPEFACEVLEGQNGQKVTLLCVPEFDKTTSAVLVNLRTLECEELSVNIGNNNPVNLTENSPEH